MKSNTLRKEYVDYVENLITVMDDSSKSDWLDGYNDYLIGEVDGWGFADVCSRYPLRDVIYGYHLPDFHIVYGTHFGNEIIIYKEDFDEEFKDGGDWEEFRETVSYEYPSLTKDDNEVVIYDRDIVHFTIKLPDDLIELIKEHDNEISDYMSDANWAKNKRILKSLLLLYFTTPHDELKYADVEKLLKKYV